MALQAIKSEGSALPYTPPPGGPSATPAASPAPTPTATVAPAPPPAPPGSITTQAASSPDYNTLLKSNPVYVAAANNASAAAGSADAQRRAAVRAAFIKYGGAMPNGWSDQYGDIDQATRDAAAANQNSTLAQLKANYDQGVNQFKRALAARHMLSSGELNYGQDQLDRGYSQQQYDASNQFLGGVNDVYGQYAGVLGQNARDMQNAVQGSLDSLIQQGYVPQAAKTANYDSGLSAQYGIPVYRGDDGQLYRQDGTIFDGSQASASPAVGAPAGSPYSDAYYAFHYGRSM